MSWIFYSLIIIPLLVKFTWQCSDSTGIETLTVSNPTTDADYPCPPWYAYEDSSNCLSATGCRDSSQLPEQLVCDNDEGAWIQFGYCITYDEQDKTFQINSCHYFLSEGHNITELGYVKLPDNISKLNDYMCGLMNRKGPLCSRCIEGFGPSLTSDVFICSNCTNIWYGVPLYLLVEFLPITVLYLIVLTFQISFTSSPMTCFILNSHIVLFALQYDRDAPLGMLLHQLSGVPLSVIKTIYGITNLEVLRFIVPPFCVSSKLQFVHISFLEYLTAFYPLCLILLTWICIKLHDRNFRPLVWAWKPFHRCFVQLRRKWSTMSDLVDVFASFFLLSYGRILFQSILLINCRPIANYMVNFSEENRSSTLSAYYDPSVPCDNPEHINIAVFAAIILCVFNILPALLLVMYPIKAFRGCLLKCKLDGLVVTTFVNKFHGCYIDSLGGRKEMRSLSGLYFFFRIILIILHRLFILLLPNIWVTYAVNYLVLTLLIAYLQPYKKTYMNILDVGFLVIPCLLCLLLSVDHFRGQVAEAYILALIPVGLLILSIVTKNVFNRLFSLTVFKQKVAMFCCKYFIRVKKTQKNDAAAPEHDYLRVTDNNLHQPITSTVVSFHEL